MGRRERKKMQSRRMILEAAVSEFSKNGYKDTSVADIMRTADLGIGTFYNYFTSKEDLLFSLLSRLGDAIRMALTEARAADRGCPRSGNCDLPGSGRPKRPGSVDGGGSSAPTTRPGPIDGARPL